MEPWKITLACLMALNILAYGLMCLDKYRSKRGGQRISENTLFLLALAFGATGIYAGMKAPLYHKASKPKFRIGVPLLIAFNALLVFFLMV